MNCKRNAPTVKKKEKLKWVFVIGRLKFQGQLIARNDTLLRCFLFKEALFKQKAPFSLLKGPPSSF